MLNPFPSLLVYGFFAPTLLRLAAACLFLYMAYVVHKHREQAAQVPLPVVGALSWAPWFTIIVYGIIGLMLFFGYYTQIAALVGALAALKELFWGKRLQAYIPLSRATSFLLLVICISLLLSGAGAIAMDLPL